MPLSGPLILLQGGWRWSWWWRWPRQGRAMRRRGSFSGTPRPYIIRHKPMRRGPSTSWRRKPRLRVPPVGRRRAGEVEKEQEHVLAPSRVLAPMTWPNPGDPSNSLIDLHRLSSSLLHPQFIHSTQASPLTFAFTIVSLPFTSTSGLTRRDVDVPLYKLEMDESPRRRGRTSEHCGSAQIAFSPAVSSSSSSSP